MYFNGQKQNNIILFVLSRMTDTICFEQNIRVTYTIYTSVGPRTVFV